MTITANDGRIEYTGNGSTTVFAYDYLLLNQAHIEVYLDGVLKTLTTHYTVSGVGVAGGGSVTFLTAPGSGVKVLLLRNVPLTQDTDYQTAAKFPAETHEAALDKLTMIDQQLDERLGRVPSLDVKSTFEDLTLPDPVSQKALRWKADLTGLENFDTTDLQGAQGAPGLNGGDLSVITTGGDMAQGGVGGVAERLAIGTAGQALIVSAGKAAWGSAGVTDHGALTGLADDDHTQYTKKATLTAKGDIYAATAASTPAAVTAGANRTLLEADSSAAPGVAWVARALGLKSMQVFTAGGTWNRPTGIRKVLVEVVGGGGGGGSTQATVDQFGAGGGGGGFAMKLLDVSAIASSTITIGALGAGGAAGSNNGAAGGNSSWADGTNTITGNGGAGGAFAAGGAQGGAGGTGTGGDVNIAGGIGGPGQSPTANNAVGPNNGGTSQRSAGTAANSLNQAGLVAAGFGGGGSGASNAGATARAGGNGSAGIIIVYEYE